ncbi:unnamed protein product, partial [Polarella glacialis]
AQLGTAEKDFSQLRLELGESTSSAALVLHDKGRVEEEASELKRQLSEELSQ